MGWNHGQFDFDIALDKIVSGAAKDIEVDEEYKFDWRSFGYYCLENYPEFIREEVLEDYKGARPNVIEFLHGLAFYQAHFIEFADFPSNDEFVENESLYRALERGISKDDLPEETSLTPPSERFDGSLILDILKKQQLTDLSIDDEYLVELINRMTSATERTQIKIDKGEK